MTALLIIITICAVIGVLDTAYLVYHKIQGTDVACVFFPKEWCQKVQYSRYSKTLGIPNSMAGLAMYIAILTALYFFISGPISFWIAAGIIAFGFLFSLYFTFIQAVVLHAFCTWCIISALNFLIMFIATLFYVF